MALLLFILPALSGLMTGPRVRRVLIWLGLVGIAVGTALLYLPGLLGGDAFYRVTMWSLLPFSLGVGLWFGVLGRRLLDAVPVVEGSVLGRIGRGGILLAFVVVGGSVFLGGLLALSDISSHQKVRFDRVDLDLAFRKAIADNLVARPDRNGFMIRGAGCSLSSGMFYRINYLTESGEKSFYHVIYDRAEWKLRNYDKEQPVELTLPHERRPY